LHVSSGAIDHLLGECRILLRKIDMQSTLIQKMKDIEEATKIASKAKATALQLIPDRQCVRDISEAEKRLNAGKRNKVARNEINRFVNDVQKYQKARDAEAERTGLATFNLLVKGADELHKLIRPYLKDIEKGDKLCGESEFVFNKAIKVIAKVKYRNEHGGNSLSNSDSITVVEKFDDIASTVDECYKDDDVNPRDGNEEEEEESPSKNERVRDVMRKFRRLAEPAHRIAILLKSQKKWTTEQIEKVKDAICDYSLAWREDFPERNICAKLHTLKCMVVPHVVEHEFYGLGSEEGFEAAHNKLAWLKNLLRSMPYTIDRGAKMGQRYQVNLIEEVAAAWVKLQPPKKQRGSYNKNPASGDNKAIAIEDDSTQTGVPDGYFKLASGNYIRMEWKEIYLMIAFGKPTSDMTGALLQNTFISESEERAAMVQFID